MEKFTLSKELIINVLNYLIEQKFKDVANLVLQIEAEIKNQEEKSV